MVIIEESLVSDSLDALGQMRALFGVHLAMIAARYGLDVRKDLRDMLPPESMSDDLDDDRGHQ
jgi:hypothetical protein